MEEKYYQLENIISTLTVLYREITIEPYRSEILDMLVEAENEFKDLDGNMKKEKRKELIQQTNDYLEERY